MKENIEQDFHFVRACLNSHEQDSRVWAALDRIQDRLRGEAAQGEQQAVVFLTLSEAQAGKEFPDAPVQMTAAGFDLPPGEHALYARPQPVAVAGDAVRALRTLAHAVFGKGLGSEPDVYADHDKLCELQRMVTAALSAAPAAPAPVAGDAVAYLVERIEGRGYGRARKVLDAAQWSPLDAAFWSDADAQRRHRVTPLYALAQDRASQAGAAGVPEGMVSEMRNFADVADRCNVTEGNAAAVIRAWADRLAAATPAAEGEVGRE